MKKLQITNDKVPVVVTVCVLFWALIFSFLLCLLYESETKAQELTSLSLEL
ncbi:MAG: hypothetical protein KAR00_01125 [Candidatus Pacebacteria bacterium]|nr:hypothetical protein [Candidatus Paceibacterota bacterium]